MKFLGKYYFALLLLLPIGVFATITSSEEFRLNRMNQLAQSVQLGTLLAKTPNVVVGKYSFAVQGGSSVATINLLRDLADSTSTITIPDNAVVKQVYVDCLTTVTGGSVAVTLASAADLFAAASHTGTLAGTIKAGVPVNTAATMIKLSANKTPSLTITNADLTAGVFNVYIEYVLGD